MSQPNQPNRQSRRSRRTQLVLTEVDKLIYTDPTELFDPQTNEGKRLSTFMGGQQSAAPRTTKRFTILEKSEESTTEVEVVKLTLRDVNLIFAMPFFCTIATRLPFIYFVIELKSRYGLSLNTIGLCIGAFHLCRVLAIAGAIFATKISHFIGSVAGIVGYTCLLFFADTSNVAVFASCNIAAGLAEASAAVFVYSKEVYPTDVDKMRMAMSNQSAFIGVAVILGFFFGGMAFQVWGVSGIAVAGIIVLGLELISLIYFLVAPPGSKVEVPVTDEAGGGDETTTDDDVANSQKEKKFRETQIANSIMAGKGRQTIMKRYSGAEEIEASYFTYLVAIIFSIESIACGYLFSIGPLFIFEEFGVNQGSIGTIFSAASLFGTILTFMAISSKGRNFQKKYVRSPYNLYVLIATISVSVLGLLVPNFIVQVVCILFLIGACELFLTLLSELQGSITTSHYYAVLGPSAQMLRRIMNVVMAITGPVFYGIFSRLPYTVAGILCVIYSCAFIIYTSRQQKENAKLIADLFVQKAGFDEEGSTDLVKKYNRLTMATSECMARMAAATLKVLGEDEDGDDDEEKVGSKSYKPSLNPMPMEPMMEEEDSEMSS